MEKQQTAVEWLQDNIMSNMTFTEIFDLIEQAKEMEKEQLIEAWEDGQDSFSSRTAEKYYNETFKN